PRQYRLTPCELELKAYGFRQDELQDAYFLPSNGTGHLIDTIFVVETPIAGYEYTPSPDRASPTLTITKMAVRSFDAGRLIVCAPPLAARVGESTVAP